MNILIPLGGLGQRFKDVGYESPKPSIKALGKEIFIEKFSKDYLDYLKIITASLYLTLIPFHKKELSTKFYKHFYELIK